MMNILRFQPFVQPLVRTVVVVAAAFALTVPTVAGATTPISGLSPMPDGGNPSDPAAVTACNVRPQLGRLYRGSETEPYLAVNPTNPSNLIAAWHQDRWSNGAAQGVLAAYSFDGGASWTPVAVPFSLCAGASLGSTGDFERASDPWLTFGPDGAAYFMALVADDSRVNNGMAVAKSVDGGATWSEPVLIAHTPANGGASNSLAIFHDKNSMTADPFDPNLVYATWTLFRNGITSLAFSRSTDGGQTWSPARPVNNLEVANPPAGVQFRQGVQIVALPDGTLVNAFFRVLVDPRGGASLAGVEQAIFRSHDQGKHWEHLDTPIAAFVPSGAFDIELGIPVRDAGTLPDLAVDRSSGALYAVWQDGRLSPFGASNILIASSTDGGDTWSAPVAVTHTPLNQAFLPAVAVAADGTVGVLFYDFRNDVFGDAELTTDVHLALFSPGLLPLGEHTLTASSFDMRQMAIARGYFPGDYVGLETDGNDFVAAFTVANSLGLAVSFPSDLVLTVDNHNRQDIVFARVSP